MAKTKHIRYRVTKTGKFVRAPKDVATLLTIAEHEELVAAISEEAYQAWAKANDAAIHAQRDLHMAAKMHEEERRAFRAHVGQSERMRKLLANLRPILTRALDVYQDTHRTTVELANEIDAAIRHG